MVTNKWVIRSIAAFRWTTSAHGDQSANSQWRMDTYVQNFQNHKGVTERVYIVLDSIMPKRSSLVHYESTALWTVA